MKRKIVLVGWLLLEQKQILDNELSGSLEKYDIVFKQDVTDVLDILRKKEDSSLLGIVFNSNFQKEYEKDVMSVTTEASKCISKVYVCTMLLLEASNVPQKKMIWERVFSAMR